MMDWSLMVCALVLGTPAPRPAPAPMSDPLRVVLPYVSRAEYAASRALEPRLDSLLRQTSRQGESPMGMPAGARSNSWNASALFSATSFEPKLALLPEPKLTPGASPITVVPMAAAPTKTPPRIEDKLCTVIASETQLGDVINLLSEQAGVNVLLLGQADTKVTVRLVKVKLAEAIGHLCASANLNYIKTSSAFVLGDPEKLKKGYPQEWEDQHAEAAVKQDPPSGSQDVTVQAPEAIITKTYLSGSVDASGLAEALNTLFKEEKLQAVAGPAARTPELGSAGTTGQEATGTLSNANPKTRLVILKGPASVVAAALDTAKQLDRARPQVAISVTIHDVGDDYLRDLGVTWTPGGTTFTEQSPRGINFGSFTRTPLGFSAAIKALESADKAKLLANPNIMVMDQERAFVLIGNKVNLPRLDRVDNNGQPIFTAVEYRAGIYLQVAPIIHENGDITLTLYPQVSTITGFNEVNGASYPNISTREAQTTLTVRTGETITMGGLLRDEELKELERVPILGQIPFFGELFTRRRHSKLRSQVIITITPTLIKPSDDR